jgi:4-amino-4-deoxy-L-arabinose transferase-like glycosyltransferase
MSYTMSRARAERGARRFFCPVWIRRAGHGHAKRGRGLAELPFFTGEEGRGHILALLFFLSISVITVWGTWQGTLPASDEAVLAQIAHEIATTRDALTMRFDGVAVHDTPPLGPWLMSVFLLLFGVNEFSARLVFVILSIVTFYVLYLAGKTASRDWGASAPGGCPLPVSAEKGKRTHWGTLPTAVGFLSAVVLAASPLFGKFTPHITLGLPFAFCTAVALLGWLYLPGRRLGLVFWGAGIAGCVLSSGAGAVLVVLGALLAGIADKARRGLWRSGGFAVATVLGLVLGGLWLIPETARSSQGLSENALWAPLIRIFRPSAATPSAMLDAFINVWLRNLPWSVPATVAAVRVVFFRGDRKCDAFVDDVDGALLVFAAVIFFPLSLAGAAALDSFLPVLPIVSIVAAREVARWLRRPGRDLAKRVWTLSHVMTALFCLLMLLVLAAPINIRRTVNDPIKDVAKMAARLTNEGSRVGNLAQPYREQCARMLFYGNRSLEKPRETALEIAGALSGDPRMIFLSSAQNVEALRSIRDFPFEIKVLYGSGDLVLFGAREPGAPDAP